MSDYETLEQVLDELSEEAIEAYMTPANGHGYSDDWTCAVYETSLYVAQRVEKIKRLAEELRGAIRLIAESDADVAVAREAVAAWSIGKTPEGG